MNKKLIILFLFWWSIVFPSLSLNPYTTQITDENISYSDLYNTKKRNEILENAEFKLWIETIFLSS